MEKPNRNTIHAVEVFPRPIFEYREDGVIVTVYSPRSDILNCSVNWYLDRAKKHLLNDA